MMDLGLAGQRVLVTGAGKGIGRAIAEAFASQDATVAVHGRTEASVADTMTNIGRAGGKAHAVTGDLEEPAAIQTLCETTLDALGGIDVVINNAGVLALGTFAELSQADWDRSMAVNMRAPFLVAKALMPSMIDQGTGGRIIFISSISSRFAWQGTGAYTASKAGLDGMMHALAIEAGSHGITVNCLCPGRTATELIKDSVAYYADKEGIEPSDEFYDQTMRANLMGQIVKPEDVANGALWLASRQAWFVTGQSINMCGGLWNAQ